jgi:aspartate carbamoyltransferase regulatory subunit
MLNKELNVSALKSGTVIDHIPAQNLFKVINVLKLDKVDKMITFGTNLDSKRLGKKGIIKIADIFFEENDINKIALFAPNARLNVVRDFEVVEKKYITTPKSIKGIVKCQNPVCITNNQRVIPRYEVKGTTPVTLKCCYCEKITSGDNIRLLD